jgi:hypothetical protein
VGLNPPRRTVKTRAVRNPGSLFCARGGGAEIAGIKNGEIARIAGIVGIKTGRSPKSPELIRLHCELDALTGARRAKIVEIAGIKTKVIPAKNP